MIDYKAVFDQTFGYKFIPDPSTKDPLVNHLRATTLNTAAAQIQTHRDARPATMPGFYLDYVENPTLNLEAYYDRQTHCGYVCIYTGVVALVYDTFYRMLSHPMVLPDIGNSSIETRKEPYCSEGLWNDYAALSKRHSSGRLLKNVLPMDTSRLAYASRLAEHALEFMILHELAHVTFGHCEYFVIKMGIPLAELNANKSTAVGNMTMQAMEIAADGYAAMTTWIGRLQNLSESEKTARAIMDKSTKVVVPDELVMFDWAFAIYIMFWMFDNTTDSLSMANEDHPSPRLRMIRAMTGIQNLMKQTAPNEALLQMVQASQAAINAGGMALMEITGSTIASRLNTMADLYENGAFDAHWRQIVTEWRTIEPDVAKFQHAET